MFTVVVRRKLVCPSGGRISTGTSCWKCITTIPVSEKANIRFFIFFSSSPYHRAVFFYLAGMVDSSGVRLYITPEVREYDAGVIELGLEYTDKMAIPPKQPDFTLTGYCIAECTAVVRCFY